jgi:uncharacterized membrane protein YcjF (UPF0283 family)
MVAWFWIADWLCSEFEKADWASFGFFAAAAVGFLIGIAD